MKVVISGYYGFGNTGDEAIALAITRELKKQGHTPVLLSNTPEESAAQYGVSVAPRMKPAELLKAIAGSDVLLSGGGGLLQDKTSSRTLAYYLGIIRTARLLRKRVIIFNQSIGPLSPAGEKKVAAALQGLKVIVRDRGSLDTLRRMGVKADLGGDPALLLEPSPELVRNPHAVVIAPRGDVTEAQEPLRQMAAHLREHGRHIIALSLMPEQDDAAARALDADQLVSTQDPQAALDIIASSGFVVGVRLHAVILAAAAGVPFAGISYDPKVWGFCEDAGAPVHNTAPDVPTLTRQVYQRTTPDWSAVEDMKFRALQSFASITR
ncbi:polysaccharide pyruvyl transferase CsaB [Deinococcus cavernae]|uniref:Polysaccharide pyruvyl transferase CsaB n=1 Tax=Deinococcus cavernae TaxID=2320857 RepID=A0A418V7T3_9DEIO|nr:polysaccharide pyruvyl transferase CsaB [Deinococcus cavernae]RJF72136.1 polysaccharide pyruvyl transferase CsaB [Deinococcus cavernae]